MKLLRRTLLAAAGVAGILSVTAVKAQQKLLRMVVPVTPGTTPDTIARAIGPVMQSKLGFDYIVENKPGASGMIGMNFVAKSTDLGTLIVIPATTVTLPLFYKTIDFDVINGFTPITQIASTSFVLVVHKDVPAKNLQEFIVWAKTHKGLFYGSPGNGTHHHLFMELLKQSAGVNIEHVPYKASAPAVNGLLGGQIPTMFMPIQTAVSQRESGRLKIIGGSLRDRHPGFPEIPSLHEQGAKDFHADAWFSVWGSPKIPSALVEQYRLAITDSLNDPAVKENFSRQGLIVKTGTPSELLALTKAESVLWSQVVLKTNIKPE